MKARPRQRKSVKDIFMWIWLMLTNLKAASQPLTLLSQPRIKIRTK